MKQIIRIILVVFLFCGIAVAQDLISSVNIVGYAKVAVPPKGGCVLVSAGFCSIGGASGGISFLELFGGSKLRGASLPQNADKVLLFDPELRAYRIYAFKASDLSFHEISPVNMWDGVATNPVISVGQGLFLQSGNSQTLTNVVSLMGQANTSTDAKVNLAQGFSLMGSPYSSALNITSNTFSGANSASTPNEADQIMIYRDKAYITYALKNDGWHMISPINSWNSPPVTNIAVGVGEGFWYKGTNSCAWNTTLPYKL